MSTIGKTTVAKIAHLARLALNENESMQITEDLTNILQLVETINDVNTDNIPPMAHPAQACEHFREDIVTETNKRELYQACAPKTENGLYLVPKVIE